MKPNQSHPTTAPRRRFIQRWPLWIALVVVVAAAFGAQQFLRSPAPPPPLVDTTGYDSTIAAAIGEARETVLKSPRSAEARGRMGMVLLAHEIKSEARECFAQASTFASSNPRWPYFLGLAQLPDDPAAAVTSFDRAIRLFPENTSAPRLRQADTLLGLGRVDDAEAHLLHVRQREPNSAPAALGLAKVANARERHAEAAEFLASATSDPSTRRAAHRLLINVNQRLGRTSEADRLTLALAGLPNDKPADPFLLEIEQLKTGEQAWLDLADDWIKTGRAPEAARLLEKTVKTYPKSDRALFFLGRALLRLGDAAGAETALSRSVQLAPGSVEAQMQLGVVRLSRGRAQQAQPCFRAAIQAKPNLGEAWFNLALTLGGEANRTESIAAFREAIRLKPDLMEAYLGLAVVLRSSGQNAEAVHELQRALDLQPPEPLRKKLLEQLKLAAQP